jgi:hypothetical protein
MKRRHMLWTKRVAMPVQNGKSDTYFFTSRKVLMRTRHTSYVIKLHNVLCSKFEGEMQDIDVSKDKH